MSRTMIQLSSGAYIDLKDPSSEPVTIRVIAHALSHLCRYTGHTRRFYSVAEHCVRASYIGDPRYALDILMHDAAEAFLGDVATPLKRQLSDYADLEHRFENIIAGKWGLRWLYDQEFKAAVKHADLVMLATEKRDLLPVSDVIWPVLAGIDPLLETLPLEDEAGTPWLWRDKFIERFVEISRDR